MDKSLQTMLSSKHYEWPTLQVTFNHLHKEFNFTLDPCSTKENAKCKKFFTKEDDGLSKSWTNETVFMNPPYCGQTGAWIKKAYDEFNATKDDWNPTTVVCLITCSPDRSYWHDYIFPFASQIRFIRGRLKFEGSKTTAPFPSAIVIFSNKKYKEKYISINARDLLKGETLA